MSGCSFDESLLLSSSDGEEVDVERRYFYGANPPDVCHTVSVTDAVILPASLMSPLFPHISSMWDSSKCTSRLPITRFRSAFHKLYTFVLVGYSNHMAEFERAPSLATHISWDYVT